MDADDDGDIDLAEWLSFYKRFETAGVGMDEYMLMLEKEAPLTKYEILHKNAAAGHHLAKHATTQAIAMAKKVDTTAAKNKAKGMASNMGSSLGKMGGSMMNYGKKKLFASQDQKDNDQRDSTTTEEEEEEEGEIIKENLTKVKESELNLKNIRDWD